MNKIAEDARSIFTAGVDAVRARPLVRREVQIDGDHMCVGEKSWSRNDFDRIIIIGAGKAATQMTAGLVEVIDGWLPYVGWINVPEGTEAPIPNITVHPARPAGRNEPSEAGVQGTQEIVQLVKNASSRDLCLALISGGGSALLPSPIKGITLEDKLNVTKFLSAAGANINELNTVRKQLSDVKGGGLLRACRAGELITMVLSDVLGDPLDLIASGPTVPDQSTVPDALAVLQRFDPNRTLPSNIYVALNNEPVTPSQITTRHHTFVIGNNAVAVDEAGIRAEGLGYNHAMQSANTSEGSAEEVGKHLAEMTLRMLREDADVDLPDQRRGTDSAFGRRSDPWTRRPKSTTRFGGVPTSARDRCQRRRVGSFCDLVGWNRRRRWSDRRSRRHSFPRRASTCRELGLDLADHLRRNDAYTFFEKTGGLLITGPTGTNVCDVRVVVVG